MTCLVSTVQVQRKIEDLVESKGFGDLFLALIFINTAVMAVEYDGMPDRMGHILEQTNIALTICFTLESVLKIVGLGWKEYSADSFNLFDLFVVATSLLELCLVGTVSASTVKCAPYSLPIHWRHYSLASFHLVGIVYSICQHCYLFALPIHSVSIHWRDSSWARCLPALSVRSLCSLC